MLKHIFLAILLISIAAFDIEENVTVLADSDPTAIALPTLSDANVADETANQTAEGDQLFIAQIN